VALAYRSAAIAPIIRNMKGRQGRLTAIAGLCAALAAAAGLLTAGGLAGPWQADGVEAAGGVGAPPKAPRTPRPTPTPPPTSAPKPVVIPRIAFGASGSVRQAPALAGPHLAPLREAMAAEIAAFED
jgi:hypothetical protein